MICESCARGVAAGRIVEQCAFAGVCRPGEVRIRARADFKASNHNAKILTKIRRTCGRWRAAAVAYFRQQLTCVRDLMGVAFLKECDLLMPTIAIAPCRAMADYLESVRRPAASLWSSATKWTRRGRRSPRRRPALTAVATSTPCCNGEPPHRHV